MKKVISRYGPIIVIGVLTVGATFAFSAFFDPVSDDSEPGLVVHFCQEGDNSCNKPFVHEPLVLIFLDLDGEGVDTNPELLMICPFGKKHRVATNTASSDFLFGGDAARLAFNGVFQPPVYFDSGKLSFLMKGLTGVLGKHADTDKDLSAGTLGDKEKPVLKAGFDPVLLGYCFVVMAFVAWWQKHRAFERDMVMCGNATGVGTMILPPPVTFGWSMAASAVKKKELALESPPLRVVSSTDIEEDTDTDAEEDPELEVMECQVPFRNSRYEIYVGMFADLAHNPALLTRLYERSLRMHRRDSGLIKKAYKETINLN